MSTLPAEAVSAPAALSSWKSSCQILGLLALGMLFAIPVLFFEMNWSRYLLHASSSAGLILMSGWVTSIPLNEPRKDLWPWPLLPLVLTVAIAANLNREFAVPYQTTITIGLTWGLSIFVISRQEYQFALAK